MLFGMVQVPGFIFFDAGHAILSSGVIATPCPSGSPPGTKIYLPSLFSSSFPSSFSFISFSRPMRRSNVGRDFPVTISPGLCKKGLNNCSGIDYVATVPANASDPFYTEWVKEGPQMGGLVNPIVNHTGDDPSTAWQVSLGWFGGNNVPASSREPDTVLNICPSLYCTARKTCPPPHPPTAGSAVAAPISSHFAPRPRPRTTDSVG